MTYPSYFFMSKYLRGGSDQFLAFRLQIFLHHSDMMRNLKTNPLESF